VQWRFSSHRMVEDYYLRVYRQTGPLPAVSRPPREAESQAPGS